MRSILVIAILILVTPAPVDGRSIYVNNMAGNDRHDGRAPTSSGHGVGPCRTIARALRAAKKGDQIVLADSGEPYRECVTLQGGRHSGFKESPFEIIGNGATLDGSMPVNEDSWHHFHDDVFRFRPRWLSYQQLFLNSVPLEKQAITGNKPPKLEPLQWCMYNRYIYFRTEKDRLPQTYNLTHTGHPVGITLYEVRNVVITDLTIQGFQLDGINAHDSAFNVTLLGLTSRGNGRSGINVGGASRVRVEACLVGNNGAAQIHTEGYSVTQIRNCDLIPNTAPAIVRKGGRITVENANAGG